MIPFLIVKSKNKKSCYDNRELFDDNDFNMIKKVFIVKK